MTKSRTEKAKTKPNPPLSPPPVKRQARPHKANEIPPKPDVPPILKPDKPGFLSRFKSRRPPSIAGVITPLNPLTVMKIGDVGDFVRLHHDEAFGWTDELCFVSVPVKGVKKAIMHLIDEDLAMEFLPSKSIKRYRLALAARATGALFFSIAPSQNLDNSFNQSALEACEAAKTQWVKATSRLAEGYEDYKREIAEPGAFNDPEWGLTDAEKWCEITFREITIIDPNDPGLLRLRGKVQKLT
jgi:hypothetical protein